MMSPQGICTINGVIFFVLSPTVLVLKVQYSTPNVQQLVINTQSFDC